MKKRIVITGTGVVSPYGIGVDTLLEGVESYTYPLTTKVISDREYLVGKVPVDVESMIPRKYSRTMPRMSMYAYLATLEAIKDMSYQLEDNNISTIIASVLSSGDVSEKIFTEYLVTKKVKSIPASTMIQMLGNMPSSNVASSLSFKGRCIHPNAACASGLQSIILGYESILLGKTDTAVCGGTEELHPLTNMIFQKVGIASRSIIPNYSPIPFSQSRDGIVCSEGAGIVLIEEYKHGMSYDAEILGTGSNSSTNMIYSDEKSITDCIVEALQEANLRPQDIDFISPHATGTTEGDISEGQAISNLFPHKPMVNNLKPYIGHTLAASGTIELIAAIKSLQKGMWYGVNNYSLHDPRCGDMYIPDLHQYRLHKTPMHLLKLSLGMGGINSAIIVKVR